MKANGLCNYASVTGFQYSRWQLPTVEGVKYGIEFPSMRFHGIEAEIYHKENLPLQIRIGGCSY